FDHALSQMLLVQSPSPTDLLRKNNPFKLPAHLALGPGSELGNYELVELLGQGGMGRVFKARQRDSQQIVAIKVIDWENSKSPRMLRRFQREIQASMQLAHPNLVRFLEAKELD